MDLAPLDRLAVGWLSPNRGLAVRSTSASASRSQELNLNFDLALAVHLFKGKSSELRGQRAEGADGGLFLISCAGLYLPFTRGAKSQVTVVPAYSQIVAISLQLQLQATREGEGYGPSYFLNYKKRQAAGLWRV